MDVGSLQAVFNAGPVRTLLAAVIAPLVRQHNTVLL